MKRGWWLALGAAALVALLVGGRWLAWETAERAWAATVAGGNVYLLARRLSRLVAIATLALSISWGILNVYFVYRTIGSVQMPRRLGNIEIIEAVPQRLLLAITLVSGIVLGIGLAWGTGDWWLYATLSTAPPHFGITDPVLHNDLGYYLGELPWAEARQGYALLAALTATAVAGLLYAGIGSLRFQRGRPVTSVHARGHLGLLLACLAMALAWGALLDPAEVVAGLHGPIDRAALDIRIPGAAILAGVSIAAAIISLIWAWSNRTNLLLSGWGTLATGLLVVYAVLPVAVRGAGGRSGARRADVPFIVERDQLERIAFGTGGIEMRQLPSLPGLAAAADVPLWDPAHLTARVRHDPQFDPHQTVAGVAAIPLAGHARGWLVAAAPDDSAWARSVTEPTWAEVHQGSRAHAGPPLLAIETDTGLTLENVPDVATETWFGPRFDQYAVTTADVPEAAAGIPLVGGWRRLALAWALQSAELARSETTGQRLLWRRDVVDRLQRLAPFADFDTPVPVVAEGRLWWISYGYVDGEFFPLVRSLTFEKAIVRYRRVGLIGAVNATTGDTHLWMAPQSDPLTAAWAHLFEPLVAPLDSMPALLRARLPFPRQAFRVAVADLARVEAGSDTIPRATRPYEPFDLTAPPPADANGDGAVLWTAQGLDSGATLVGVLAGSMSASQGQRLYYWRPSRTDSLPPPVLGYAQRDPGLYRFWPAGGRLLTVQAQFERQQGSDVAPRLARVYLTWGDRRADDSTLAGALRQLQAATPADTTLQGRWLEAQRLAAEADSALSAGDLEKFGRLYRRLLAVLRVTSRRKLAPVP